MDVSNIELNMALFHPRLPAFRRVRVGCKFGEINDSGTPAKRANPRNVPIGQSLLGVHQLHRGVLTTYTPHSPSLLSSNTLHTICFRAHNESNKSDRGRLFFADQRLQYTTNTAPRSTAPSQIPTGLCVRQAPKLYGTHSTGNLLLQCTLEFC